jgi:dihydrofolate reductase
MATSLSSKRAGDKVSSTMRRLRYSVAASLDGFIADPNGGYDWIIMDEDIDFAAIFDEFDTFVMGRKTWEVSSAGDAAPMFGDKEVIVFSQTLKTASRPGVTVVNTPPAATVRELKQQSGKDIWLFGGGSMFRTLLDADLVDTIEIAVMPVLLSEGVPILAPGMRVAGLKLDKCERLPNSGVVMLSYAIPQK